ncbi:nuclear transport factor 2 family protein [Aquimarina algiphila]|uniref:nuclear transport factor 2 family protein n=1 Tax=Aquimarina algiphila TaxID=2047982 RepID=UPI00232E2C3A|nr:nuclear transport factor 2 family protein [Aquimarina algiphila]
MSSDKSKEKDSIIKVEQEILIAMKNCDVKKLDGLLHEELLFNIPNGQTITKSMDLETYSSGNMKIHEIKSSELEINLIAENAIVSLTIEMKGKYFDFSIDGKYRVLRVWKLFNDNWKVIAGSSNEIKTIANTV